MISTRKTRSDAKLFQLTEAQQATLAEMMLNGVPYHKCQEWVKEECHEEVRIAAFTPFWQQVCVPQLLLRRSKAVEASDAIVADAAKNKGNVDQALLLQLKAKALEVCNSPSASAEEIMFVCSMALKVRDQDLALEKQQLARNKFEFDAAEACLKHLPSLRTIAAKTGVAQKEKIRQIRLALFGSAPE